MLSSKHNIYMVSSLTSQKLYIHGFFANFSEVIMCVPHGMLVTT